MSFAWSAMMHSIKRFLSVTMVFIGLNAYSAPVADNTEQPLSQSISDEPASPKKLSRKRQTPKDLNFYFTEEDLVDIINFLAAQKEANIVLPMGANAINAKVTLHLEDKITLDQAWDMLYTLLDIAGYSMIAKENTYTIVKTNPEITREPVPLYIVKPEEIPDTDKRIRYLYYFQNLKIADDTNNDIVAILKDVLPDLAKVGQATRIDSQSNSLLISDKANDIKAVMNIVVALDQVEAQERPDVIHLRYQTPDIVANLFNESLLKTAADINQLRLGIRAPNNSTYFKKVRIVPDMRNNSLIVFGRPQAVERVREFIHKYIDVEIESGKSILHVYQLQYLDADKFRPVLETVVKSGKSGGTGQSKAGPSAGGAERFFDEVIILADQPQNVSGQQPGSQSRGSNNLIIAARNDDWERIKKVIEELDTPTPLIIIEVLIADLTIQDIAALGTSVRNPLGALPPGVNFQSAQATDFLTNTVVNPATIQADLLRTAFNQSGVITSSCDTPSSSGCSSVVPFITGGVNQGTALLSFNDAATGQTWGLAQVRKFLDGHKILYHPHLITQNNVPAEILIGEERLALDQGSGATGGTTTQTRKWLPANLSVTIRPRISASDVVNLEVAVKIDQFVSPAFSNSTVTSSANTANRFTRNVITNANVRTGRVLSLGGLTRIDSAADQFQTPLLGNIPLIGWLFKDRTNTVNKNNLTVFISPTIIMPRVRGGVSTYTKNHVQLAKSYSGEGMLFDNLRDPITRWFFKTQQDDAEIAIDDFISQDEFIAPTIFDTRQEVRRSAHSDKGPRGKKSILVSNHSARPKRTIISKAPTPLAAQSGDLKDVLADAQNPFESSKNLADHA